MSSSVWNYMSKEDTHRMERVQATSMVIGLRSLEYQDRLKELGLTTIETRRIRGDLIQL